MLLDGVRVLDLSRVLAGPYCTMILGDLGADVLKVERPGSGDETRTWGPPFDERGESAYYLSINRNKLGVTADMTIDADRARIRGWIAEADVVVDNYRAGTLERWGLGAAAMLAAHPTLVWCTISGFGPGSSRPGYDFVVQAESGWMAITGEPDGEPMKAGVAIVDVLCGKDAAIGILGALVAVGRAQGHVPALERHVQVSLAASAVGGLVNVAQNALVSGRDASRWGNAHANLVPYQLFHATDRPLVIAVGNDGQWRACATALGLPELAADPRFATNPGRLAHREELVAVIANRVRERPASEWLSALDAAGVPAGIVKTVLEALGDVAASPLTGVAPSVPGSVRRVPPRLGEHDAVVRDLGWRAFRAV
jgi:crotonobetainyl-CoA:carnitine CoA-transferase CaiB-like acyl-CoA transferase